MKIFEEYINNSFAGITETEELKQIKHDMLINMEERYEELIAAGLSPHEAIGSVIVDFGDIDELLVEMGYTTPEENPTIEQVDFMPLERIQAYLKNAKENAILIAAGVALIIIGVANANFVDEFTLFPNLTGVLPGIIILISVAIAVGVFIFAGTRGPNFDDFDEWFIVKADTRHMIEQEFKVQQRQFMSSLITGVMVLILSPVIILVAEVFNSPTLEQLSTSIFLVIVAIGIFLLINAGMTYSAYDTILENGKSVSEYYQRKDSVKADSTKPDKINSIIWSIATMGYLAWSFLSGDWHITWIVFPLTGLLQNIISTVYGTE